MIDAAGKLVIPGAVDIHVHLQMPSARFHLHDDFYTGTRAAAFGGTTTIVDFVEAQPDETMLEALAARRALADPQVVIDYGLHMTIGPHEIAKLDQVQAAYEAGCGSFKLYMAYGFRLDDGQLLRALEAIRDAGGQPVIHAENWDVIYTLIERHQAAGRTRPHWHPRSRPAPLEGEAAGRAIDIANFVGAPLHIFHVSCAEVVERIAAARAAGWPISGETCPQYLFLTWDAYDAAGLRGALPVCSPPIREKPTRRRCGRPSPAAICRSSPPITARSRPTSRPGGWEISAKSPAACPRLRCGWRACIRAWRGVLTRTAGWSCAARPRPGWRACTTRATSRPASMPTSSSSTPTAG